MIAKMRNIGEACTAANRFHVAESRRGASSPSGWPSGWARCKVGRGTEEGVEVGPLINEEQRRKVEELVEDAVKRGAQAASSAASRVDGARLLLSSRPCWPTFPTTRAC